MAQGQALWLRGQALDQGGRVRLSFSIESNLIECLSSNVNLDLLPSSEE